MAQTIFPQTGDGQTQAAWTAALSALSLDTHYIVLGYSLSDGGGLNVDVAAGTAFINGFLVTDDAAITGNALADDDTNSVFLEPDGSITINVTGTNPGNSILLGTVLTAAGIVSVVSHEVSIIVGSDIMIQKKSSQGNSTTTLANDDDFVFPVGKRQVWEVYFQLHVTSPTAADFKASFITPSGTVWKGVSSVLNDAALGLGISAKFDVSQFTLATNNSGDTIQIKMIVWTADASGTVQFQWAQVSTSGTTFILPDSYMTARRISG